MRGAFAALPLALGLLSSTLPESRPVSFSPVYAGIPINLYEEYAISVLDKGHYVIGYSEDFLNPAWVFYRIGPAEDFRSFPRPGFRIDMETESQVSSNDYANSGYSRGHMAPNFALGSRFGQDGARSTFVMSNVCPQFQSFNDAQWGELEEWIAGRKAPNDATGERFARGWADLLEEVWVVVGPIFDEERMPLETGIPVPNAFFCVVVDEVDGEPRALAFIMPHVDERVDDLAQYQKTIDEVERRAGLDLFHELPDAIERELERAKGELWELPRRPR